MTNITSSGILKEKHVATATKILSLSEGRWNFSTVVFPLGEPVLSRD